jgi:hypothetical protein
VVGKTPISSPGKVDFQKSWLIYGITMLSKLIKRASAKTTGPQCPQTIKQRRIVFCDWGWHGRGSNDGWVFTYVDEVDFDPDEDLRCYTRTNPNDCGETLSKFVKSQLRKNKNLKESSGW